MSRPIIFRSLLILVLAGGGWAFAGFPTFGKKTAEEAPAAAPAEAAPAAPDAPALFAEGLPVAIQKTPEGLANVSAQSCNACHFQAHEDWSGSAHATAWSGEIFQEALARAGGSTACSQCHLPLTNQHAKLAAGYIEGDLARPTLQTNPIWDATLMSEGVTCAACHVRDGVVIGTRAVDNAPHTVAVSEELSSSAVCATCHQMTWEGADQPFYDTYREWEGSAYAEAGVRCQDCHMPPRAGLATASRFAATPSHNFTADIARAVSVLVKLQAPEIQRGQDTPIELTIQNTGAGHHFPTGSPFKPYTIIAEIVDANGKLMGPAYTHKLARSVEDQSPWRTLSDNRIPAGGELKLSHVFNISHKKKAGPATLRIRIGREAKSSPAPIVQKIRVEIR
jgi:nitrate/TMAO reductase-like tetraheme cytochrome c subunit